MFKVIAILARCGGLRRRLSPKQGERAPCRLGHAMKTMIDIISQNITNWRPRQQCAKKMLNTFVDGRSTPQWGRQGYAPVCLGIPKIWEKLLIHIHRCILLLSSYKECSFRRFQTHYSFKEMTLLPLITYTNCD